MLGFTDFFWRLLPANPILLRVVEAGSKRWRDLIIRCAYLGLLVILVLLALGGSGGGTGGELSALNVTSRRIFEQLSFVQLLLVALLAPVFTAAAITQEKDSQTYDILLATPLTNGQIVLGSLMSRLFFVFSLLLSGVPIFSITQIFGGVAIGSIVQSVLLAAVTATVTGALAIAIATFKVGTRRTIFAFYLTNVIYLVGFYLLAQTDAFRIPRVDATGAPTDASAVSWLAGVHPFLALEVVLRPLEYAPPTITELPQNLRFWPVSWLATNPVSFFLVTQTAFALLLICPSIVLLRRVAQSTTSWRQAILRFVPIHFAGRPRPPRTVWHNPIAWREARTKASAARATVMRLLFIVGGVIGAGIVLVLFASTGPLPREFVKYGSLGGDKTTVLLYGDRQATYRLSENPRITVNGKPADVDALNGYFEVRAKDAPILRGAPTIRSIDLVSMPRRIDVKTARQYLLGLVLVEVTAILFIVTNAAASTVTREKEDGTLDLLLSTPITSRYYLWGKVRGLVSYVIPLLAVPVVSCAAFVIYDAGRYLFGGHVGFEPVVFPEALLIIPGLLIVLAAFASIVGMQMSLRLRTTVLAVMSSTAIVIGVCGAMGWCGFTLVSENNNPAAVAVSSFSPFTVLMLMIAAPEFAQNPFGDPYSGGARLAAAISSIASIGVYCGLLWWLYRSMVRNFDMTIRRQSR